MVISGIIIVIHRTIMNQASGREYNCKIFYLSILLFCIWLILISLHVLESFPLFASLEKSTFWEVGAPMPTARSEAGGVALDNKIYVLGGGDVLNSEYVILKDRNLGMTDVVEVYDPIKDNWQTSTKLPEPLDHVVAATDGNKLYVVGGFDKDRNPSGKLYIYDPNTQAWHEGKSMPTPRGAPAGEFVNRILYVIGGMKNHEGDEDEGPLTTNEAYNPATDTWTEIAPMPTPRHHHDATLYNEKIYILGGRMTGLQSNVNSNEIYDPASDSWTIGEPVPIRNSGFAAEEVNGTIHLFGGEGPLHQAFKDIIQYDPQSDRWVRENASMSDYQVPTPRLGLVGVVIDNKVYLIGGKIGRYEPATDRNEIFTLQP